MQKLKSDIESSVWIFIYCKMRTNNISLMVAFALGFILTYFLRTTEVLDESEMISSFLGISMSMIGYAFVMGLVHFFTGREIRMIATKNMVEPSEVQEIAHNIFG